MGLNNGEIDNCRVVIDHLLRFQPIGRLPKGWISDWKYIILAIACPNGPLAEVVVILSTPINEESTSPAPLLLLPRLSTWINTILSSKSECREPCIIETRYTYLKEF